MASRKKKVIHAISHLSKGGAETQCRMLANNLNPERFDVAILYFYEGPNPDLAPHVRRIQIARGSWSGVFNLAGRINQIIEREKPDLVQAWLPEVISVPATLASRRLGIPVISGHRTSLDFNWNWNIALRDRLRSLQYILANRIISNFDVTEEPLLFRWLYMKKRGICIQNGIDTSAIRGLPARKLPGKAQHKLIFSGRLSPQKGLPLAFHAVKYMIDAGTDVELILFGEGHDPDYFDKLKALVASLGIEDRITFFGPCNDWHAFAADAACLVFPSLAEGVSNVVLESLAIGLPVVISELPMTRQILTHETDSYIVKNRDPSSWAEALNTVLDDRNLRSRLVRNGKKLGDQFSIPKMVSQYEAVYNELT